MGRGWEEGGREGARGRVSMICLFKLLPGEAREAGLG